VFGAKDDEGVHGDGALAGFADHQWVHADNPWHCVPILSERA
jgi:hypothetical protein